MDIDFTELRVIRQLCTHPKTQRDKELDGPDLGYKALPKQAAQIGEMMTTQYLRR